mmetsp:Transcript_2900/g.8623  ORF Transcript_2900/g.8623 Transcript_2900/m.8623 type:complete len:210 (+) Transcript_2900:1945-2574(+)
MKSSKSSRRIALFCTAQFCWIKAASTRPSRRCTRRCCTAPTPNRRGASADESRWKLRKSFLTCPPPTRSPPLYFVAPSTRAATARPRAGPSSSPHRRCRMGTGRLQKGLLWRARSTGSTTSTPLPRPSSARRRSSPTAPSPTRRTTRFRSPTGRKASLGSGRPARPRRWTLSRLRRARASSCCATLTRTLWNWWPARRTLLGSSSLAMP